MSTVIPKRVNSFFLPIRKWWTDLGFRESESERGNVGPQSFKKVAGEKQRVRAEMKILQKHQNVCLC